MLVNFKTDNGNAIINTDNVDAIYLSELEKKMYIFKNNFEKTFATFTMSQQNITDALKQFDKIIVKQEDKVNTD